MVRCGGYGTRKTGPGSLCQRNTIPVPPGHDNPAESKDWKKAESAMADTFEALVEAEKFVAGLWEAP